MSPAQIRLARQRSWERQAIVSSAAALSGAVALGGAVGTVIRTIARVMQQLPAPTRPR
jgi:hypothetical protein